MGFCRALAAVATLATLLASAAPWLVLYTLVDLLHDGAPLGQALRDLSYTLDRTAGLHPFPAAPSKHGLEVDASDDHAAAICKLSMYVKMVDVTGWLPVVDSADQVPTPERLLAYVAACREVLAALPAGGRQARLLEAHRPALGVPTAAVGVTVPATLGTAQRDDPRAFRERRDGVAAARAGTAAAGAGADGVRPPTLTPWHVPAAGVADAARRGQVATFDAREILPAGVFNLTWTRIAELHGADAERIPVYRQSSHAWAGAGSLSLAAQAAAVRRAAAAGKSKYPEVLETTDGAAAMAAQRPAPAAAPLRALRDLVIRAARLPPGLTPEGAAHLLRRELHMTTINSRRLPALGIDVEGALGSPQWVERVQSLLWSGAVGYWWHNDEPDNLLVCLGGEIQVAVFDPRDTEVIAGSRGPVHPDVPFDLGPAPTPQGMRGFHPDANGSAWTSDNAWIRGFPMARLTLRPGMGVVVPSRAYHAVWSDSVDRILLNSFLIPRFGAADDAPSNGTNFYGPGGGQSELYLALLHLKQSSLARLWETRRLGGFFEHTKLEFL